MRRDTELVAIVLFAALLALARLFVGGNTEQLSRWRMTLEPAPAEIESASAAPFTSLDSDTPTGNPLRSDRTLLTQGYDVGTHAPARIWGAIDLAIDGDGNGVAGSSADVNASQGAPVYATHAGVVKLSPATYPAGNHIWVENSHYKTGYSHLDRFADGLSSGQTVRRGDLIGYLGNTGMSSGPHLDYQVWKKEGPVWVNQNPHNYRPFDTVP